MPGTPPLRGVVGAGGAGTRLSSPAGCNPVPALPKPWHPMTSPAGWKTAGDGDYFGGGAFGKLHWGYFHLIWTNTRERKTLEQTSSAQDLAWCKAELCAGFNHPRVYPPGILPVGLIPNLVAQVNAPSPRHRLRKGRRRVAPRRERDETPTASPASSTGFHSDGFGPRLAMGAGEAGARRGLERTPSTANQQGLIRKKNK